MIRLSVIIPVYNNVTYIGKAIHNYLSLASDKTELIIIDGGSSDGTLEEIKAYSKKHLSIIWISEQDRGQSDAMNKGIRLANGQYISFLNVDDYYSPETFTKVLQILDYDTSINFLVGDCNVFDEKGGLIYINRPSKLKKWHLLSGYHFPVNPTAYFYRKDIHESLGYYNENNHFNMDLEFLVLARLKYEFTYFPIIWGNFRVLPNTKTALDVADDSLERKKFELLNHIIRKQNFYIRIRTHLYKFIRIKKLLSKTIFNLILDKLIFEIKKRFR